LKAWSAYDHRQVKRFLETPHICRKWRGTCDGLSAFNEIAIVYQNGRILFSGAVEAADDFLRRFLACTPSPARPTELIEMGCA
jgi:hypothetical protein